MTKKQPDMKTFSALITGSTGMVGRAVLLECLDHERVSEVLVVNRSPLDLKHPKLREVLLSDFTKADTIQEALRPYDACFFCAGVSSIGMDEEKFKKLTYDLTVAFAQACHAANPDMVFNYVSGAGTDSSEQGRVMWARVKGATENAILKMGFRDAYAFRPGAILPQRGIRSRTGWYQAIYVVMRPLFPILQKFDSIVTTTQFGRAMINSVLYPQEQKHLDNPDIGVLSSRHPMLS